MLDFCVQHLVKRDYKPKFESCALQVLILDQRVWLLREMARKIGDNGEELASFEMISRFCNSTGQEEAYSTKTSKIIQVNLNECGLSCLNQKNQNARLL